MHSRSFWDISFVCTSAETTVSALVHEDQKTRPASYGLYLSKGFFHCYQPQNRLPHSDFEIILRIFFWECRIRPFDVNDGLKREEYLSNK